MECLIPYNMKVNALTEWKMELECAGL